MTTALTEQVRLDPKVIESVLLGGDLSKLTPEQRLSYYNRLCDTLGLNPLTQPFKYITLNGRLVLYALKDATDQLRFVHSISIDVKAREVIEGIYVVTAGASMPTGRRDESTGAVPVESLKGEARANAMMKAETKAKRRATLSICGLGILDETEVETIPKATYVVEVPAPALSEPIPDGAVRILSVAPGSKGNVQWAVVTYVDAAGEQHEAKTAGDPKGGAAALCEQLAQEGAPVELTTRINRNGATVIDAVRRWLSPRPTDAPDVAVEPLSESEILF